MFAVVDFAYVVDGSQPKPDNGVAEVFIEPAKAVEKEQSTKVRCAAVNVQSVFYVSQPFSCVWLQMSEVMANKLQEAAEKREKRVVPVLTQKHMFVLFLPVVVYYLLRGR